MAYVRLYYESQICSSSEHVGLIRIFFALTAMADSKIEDMAMLYHVCSERNIMLSPAMTDYYRELNANLVLEEGMQDNRRWTDKAVSQHNLSHISLYSLAS